MAPVFALTTTTIGVIGLVIIAAGWVVYGVFNVVGGRKEVGSEVELAANRKEYYDDETLEGPRLERVQLLGVIMLGDHRRRTAAVLGVRTRTSSRSARGLGQPLRELGIAALRSHGRRWLQLRRLSRWHGGRRRRSSVHCHRPGHAGSAGRQLEGSGAQHLALQVRRERDPVHPQLRTPVLADVAVGSRRRWPDEHPADRQPDRLHQEHPDPPRELRRG